MKAPAISTEHIDAVIFDLDGVVTDTASVHAAAWKRMLDGFLLERSRGRGEPFRPFDREVEYRRHVDGKTREDGLRSFLSSRGISLPEGSSDDTSEGETVRGLANRKNRMVLEHVRRHGVDLFPSAVSLIERLRELGIHTALISASRNAREVLQAAGAEHLFDARVDGKDAAELGLPGKPDPAIFLEAARRLGAQPERAAVVEDALAGVEAGRRGGFALVIGVDRAGRGRELLERGAGAVVADLAEVRVTGPPYGESRAETRVPNREHLAEAGAASPTHPDPVPPSAPVAEPMPETDRRSEWLLSVEGLDPEQERAREACLTIGDGRIGTGGSP
ncbi:MAG TPA: beta-phosphoglucomutase family hydrolase, partial [Planctomycetota bacterium]|nr:beta-phosphoglucomutase family hydrolase [Planctomycetota bacterium]